MRVTIVRIPCALYDVVLETLKPACVLEDGFIIELHRKSAYSYPVTYKVVPDKRRRRIKDSSHDTKN